MVKDGIHSSLYAVYATKGYDDLLKCAWDIIVTCEANASKQVYRQMKGETAEVVLEFGLRELQEKIKPSVVVKGLCIPLRTGHGSTTEMDLIFVTKRRIYLFESKAYQGSPKVTGECMIGDSMDVAGQNRYHLKALNEYIGGCKKKSSNPPYKLMLFEMSTKGLIDERDEADKKRIPIVSQDNFMNWLINDYNSLTEDVWDVRKVVEILQPLADNSDEIFKIHLNRMIHKKG